MTSAPVRISLTMYAKSKETPVDKIHEPAGIRWVRMVPQIITTYWPKYPLSKVYHWTLALNPIPS